MKLFKKIKDILFDEEEYTEQIKITPEMRNDDTPEREQVVSAPKKADVVRETAPVKEEEVQSISERELFNTKSSSPFFDFDEDEFETSKPEKKPEPEPIKKTYMAPPVHPKTSLDYEIKKRTEVRTDYGRYEKTVITETTEKKKFKPSPIISPVYGILHQDYQKEDIVKKADVDDIDIQKVRDKAFGEKRKVEEKDSVTEELPRPKTTFYEETITVKVPDEEETKTSVKSIDELLNDDAPVANNVIEDEFNDTVDDQPKRMDENLERENTPEENINEEHVPDMNEDTLENDLFDLIDSMYDTKEEE